MTIFISKQHLAIGIINTVISDWEDTFPMLHEHPELKKELIYIRRAIIIAEQEQDQ